VAGDKELARVFAQLADLEASDCHDEHLRLMCEGIVDVCQVDDAGVLGVDEPGEPYVAAATSETVRRAHQVELRLGEGPCVDCCRSGRSYAAGNVAELGRWPRFADAAGSLGYVAVQALPMQPRNETVAAVNLFNTTPGGCGDDDLLTARALVAVAGTAIANRDLLSRRDQTIQQLQTALDSRVVIEQAKGLVMGELNINETEAFALLRGYARSNNLHLHQLAADVVRSGAAGWLRRGRPPHE
jgi:hypothetical protein